jgi:hypothetical protein
MRKLLLSLALALVATAAVPAMASASSTVRLKMPHEIRSGFPSVYWVKATNLPRLTYGYAPRQLVAETVVGQIQHAFATRGRVPRSVHPQGARWDGGRWSVSYRIVATEDSPYGHFVVRKGSQRLTFDGGS